MGVSESSVQPNSSWTNGLLPNTAASVTRKLDEERWLIAEERTTELIACIQPNKPSEELRNAVADYVQRLIMKCFPCQVFTFGSVPLKTYLPDGDIDLTAFSKDQNLKDTWANDVRDMLEVEEKREDAEFHVKEVQYIQAEVKIIKCLVENIVVDISFNQLGGLCTLCFLEEVDNLINRNHLFKRSIILIKAWCYYESRILGAHHGLISTYALETLVLYIFHVFNNSFVGPLEVLYRFLEFFSCFDWENFCLSLWGPIYISQLPDITVEPPRKDGGDLLLSKPFLDACGSVYAVCPGMLENQGQTFVPKHFNVIDPLRTNNNLGRSVSKGNFFRIRSAFAFGAKKLERLLECPKEHLTSEVEQFFMNTWERHGSGRRPDAPSPDLCHLHPPNIDPRGGTDNSRNHITMKREEHCEGLMEVSHSTSSDGTSAILSASAGYTPRASNPSEVHRSFSHKNYNKHNIGAEKSHNGLKANYSSNGQETQTRYQFSRTSSRSSPELTETSTEPSVRGRPTNKASELGKDRYIITRPDQINRRKNEPSETSISHRSSSAYSLRHSSSRRNLEACQPSPLNNYVLGDGNESQQDLQQEEQDIMTMMAATRAHGFPGPMNVASSHIPVPLQPSTLGHSQSNFGGLMPTNLPFIDPAWASGVQFPPGIVSSHLVNYFSGLGLSTNQDEVIDSSNESSTMPELHQESNDAACWSENDNASATGSESAYSWAGASVGTVTRKEQQKFQNSRGTDVYVPEKTANLRLSANDVNPSNLPNSSWEKSGRKAVPGVLSTAYEKSRPSWQYEDDASVVKDEMGNNVWRMCSGNEDTPAVPAGFPVTYEASTGGSETMIPGPMFVGSGSHQITFYPTGPPVPFVTMLPIYNFTQDAVDSSGSPRAFDRHEGSLENRHANISQHGVDTSSFAASQNLHHSEAFVRRNSLETSTREPRHIHVDILNSDFISHWQNLQYGRVCQSPRNCPPLIYSPQFVVPPVYLQGQFPWEGPGRPSSTTNMELVSQITRCGSRLVPVAPLQSSSSRTPRVYQQHLSGEMPRFRSGTGTYLPNPKPVHFRDRLSANRANRRNYNYDRNEHGANDRRWNLNSRPRRSKRSHNRYDACTEADELGSRSDHQRGSDTCTSQLADLSGHDGFTSFPTQNGSFPSDNPGHGMGNVAYDMYPIEAVKSNGVGSSLGAADSSVPAIVMLHPYEHSVGYTKSQDELEFGYLGPVQFGSSNTASQSGGGSIPALYEDQHDMFRGGSPSQSSPEQPSSPQLQRSTCRMDYSLVEEDSPPTAHPPYRESGGW